MKIVIAGPSTAWTLPRNDHQVGAEVGLAAAAVSGLRNDHQVGAEVGLAAAAVSGRGGALRTARWLTGLDSMPDVASDMIPPERTNRESHQ